MTAKRTTVRDLWIGATLSEIQRALEDSADDEEQRRRRIDEIAEWVRSTPFSVDDAIRAAVARAVEAGMITEDEAQQLMEQP